MLECEHNKKGGFYMMPRQLFTEDCPLSLDAKVLYTMIIDRTQLSLQNKWRDKNGKIFIYFSVEEAGKLLGCSRKKAGQLMAELEHYTYIYRKKQGLGKPALIYLNRMMLPTMSRQDDLSFENGEIVLSRPDISSHLDKTFFPSNYTHSN